MKVLLINPPYQTLTSNWGVGHQVPLGLLMIGGPLRDAGHEVRLLDAECRRLTMNRIVGAALRFGSDVVMTGHAGSTPAHPVCVRMLQILKAACPQILTVYGGVYPTYHAEAILEQQPAIDFIIRGEGEATTTELINLLQASRQQRELGDVPLASVAGLAYRDSGKVVLTGERAPIHDLDNYRVGWELIPDWSRYQCFGLGRAAIVQLSRGCPHRCTYCGQHGFWVKWRHRDPTRLAEEIEWLYRTHGVRFLTLADENPTTLRPVWQRFLEEMADRRLPVHFFATLRATDIVRDADLLPLYRKAGILYVLLGVDSTDEEVLKRVHKGSTPGHDVLACRLLKENGIFSILGQVVGFEEETWASLRAARERLAHYEADWLNAMYATPHPWTPFGREALPRLIDPNRQHWDYRHPVLGQKHLRPRQLFLWVKWLELWFHLRPRRLWALLRTRDRFRRRQLWWVFLHIGLVWLAEIVEHLRDRFRVAQVRGPDTVKLAEEKTPPCAADEGVRRQDQSPRHADFFATPAGSPGRAPRSIH
jgi:anaerobic magnesium-protoporphyrin IX monomethyl ester cyclase